MRLPPFLKQFFGFSTKHEYLLTLILRDDCVKAVVYEELEGSITGLDRGMEVLPKPIDGLSIDELLEVCDRVIVQAEEFLPPGSEVHKTIFGIKEDWQRQEKISKEHLEKLKRLKVDLELLPLGFVVVSDAIAYSLAREEGAPINAILVELGLHTMGVSLIRAARIAESKTVHKTTDPPPLLIEKVLKGFTSFEVLPSRIILFNGEKDLKKVRQACIAHPFSKNLPFLHAPRIEVLPQDFDEKAVVFGIATEMGLSLGKEEKEEEKDLPAGPLRSEASKADEKKEEKTEEELAFGFVKDQDIGTRVEAKEEKTVTPKFSLHFLYPFVKKLQGLQNIVLAPRLPSIQIKIRIPAPGRIMLIPIILILIIVLYVVSYLLLPKARVEIIVSPKILEEERNIVIDPNVGESTSDRVKGTVVSAVLEGNKTAQTSSKKEVGEKARGEITIYNVSDEKRTFSKGIIITVNNLKFSLDTALTVASASGDAISGKTPSKEKVLVTALEIGEESNLSSGTTFTVAGSNSEIAAKNDDPFSGGSKREVTVVSKNDQDDLLKTLSEELRSKALDEIVKEEEGIRVIHEIVSENVLEKTFDKKVDEEAQNLKLSAKIEFQGLAYNEKELQSMFEKRFKSMGEVEGLILSQDGLEMSVKSFKKGKNGSVQAHVISIAHLVPQFDLDKIERQIAFTSVKKASEYLKTLQNVSDVTISVSPIFPFLPKNLPLRTNNIEIAITVKE